MEAHQLYLLRRPHPLSLAGDSKRSRRQTRDTLCSQCEMQGTTAVVGAVRYAREVGIA